MRWKVLAIVGLLAVAAGAVGLSTGMLGRSDVAATSLLTAVASVADVTDEVAASGSVEATATWAVGFGQSAWPADEGSGTPAETGVSWPVTEVRVAIGDIVAAGDVLASAGTGDLESQITDANRAVKSAALQLRQARADLDDAESGAPRRQARMAVYSAESSKGRADAELAALVAMRDHATLTSPVDGVVTDVAIGGGRAAPVGASITIASRTLAVSTSVVEADVTRIELGQVASVTIRALDTVVEGTVASIAPTAEAGAGSGVVSYAVTVALAAPPGGLRPGMSADVTIVTATVEDVLAVPSRALSGSAGSYSVRVVADDGSVEARAVTIGLVTSSLAEVTSGLQAGESVVTGTSSSQVSGPIRAGGGTLPGPGGGFIGR